MIVATANGCCDAGVSLISRSLYLHHRIAAHCLRCFRMTAGALSGGRNGDGRGGGFSWHAPAQSVTGSYRSRRAATMPVAAAWRPISSPFGRQHQITSAAHRRETTATITPPRRRTSTAEISRTPRRQAAAAFISVLISR